MDFQCQDHFVVPSLFLICWASPPETPSNHVCYTCEFPSFCPRVSFHCRSAVCRGQIHELKNPYPQGNSGYKDGVAENEYHENTVVWDVSSGWRVSLGIHHKGGCILLQMICVPWGCLNKALQPWVAWNNRNVFSHTPGGPESKIMVSAGLSSLWSLQGRIHSRSLPVSGSWEHSSSLYLALSLCWCLWIQIAFYKNICHVGLGAHYTASNRLTWSHLN